MLTNLLAESDILSKIDFETGSIGNQPVQEKRLSDLNGYFVDEEAYRSRLEKKDELLYTVSSVESNNGPGQMHFGLGILHPGKIGNEYFLTKGHFHSVREAAEVYIGLKGQGHMILEHETSHESVLVSLCAGEIVYVPGYTAHRTTNTGRDSLVYLGVYPWDAGHDYGAIAERNFLKVLVDVDGEPTFHNRADHVSSLNK